MGEMGRTEAVVGGPSIVVAGQDNLKFCAFSVFYHILTPLKAPLANYPGFVCLPSPESKVKLPNSHLILEDQMGTL
jgi:hypothetical protein